MGRYVRLEVDDGVGVIRLDRPPANAFDLRMGQDLQAARPGPERVRLAGAGRPRDDGAACDREAVVAEADLALAAEDDEQLLLGAGPARLRLEQQAVAVEDDGGRRRRGRRQEPELG